MKWKPRVPRFREAVPFFAWRPKYCQECGDRVWLEHMYRLVVMLGGPFCRACTTARILRAQEQEAQYEALGMSSQPPSSQSQAAAQIAQAKSYWQQQAALGQSSQSWGSGMQGGAFGSPIQHRSSNKGQP